MRVGAPAAARASLRGMCSGNESEPAPGRSHPELEPHQLDAEGDPHVAYLWAMPGEPLGAVLERCFRRFDEAGYRAEIAASGLERVARDEYRHLIALRALDTHVAALALALCDVLGEVEEVAGPHVVTVDEIARQFVRLAWSAAPDGGGDVP